MKSTSPTEYTLQYKPHEPGIYLFNAKFGDEHVPGTIKLFAPQTENSNFTNIFKILKIRDFLANFKMPQNFKNKFVVILILILPSHGV